MAVVKGLEGGKDARRWSPHFRNDEEPYRDDDTGRDAPPVRRI